MKIVITESQLTNIKEMVVSSLPSQKLLKWFEMGEHLLSEQTKYLIGSITLAILSTFLAALFVVNSASDAWNIYLLFLLCVLLINYFLLKKVAFE